MGRLPKMESKKQKPYKAPKPKKTVVKAPKAPKFEVKRAGKRDKKF